MTGPRRLGISFALTLSLAVATIVTGCATSVAVRTGLRYTPGTQATVLRGATAAGCSVVGTSGSYVTVRCATRSGGIRRVQFINDGGSMTAQCYNRTAEGCVAIATRILSIGGGPVRVVVIR